MTRTLITGANKGLGYETARRLLEQGHEVWVAARDPELGGAAAERLGASFVVLGYPTSKAALNMLTVKWARAHPRWRVNAADPGYTATDLNGNNGTQTVQEGTDAIVTLACLDPGGPTGSYIDRNGVVPW